MSTPSSTDKRQCLCERNRIKEVAQVTPTNPEIIEKCADLHLSNEKLKEIMKRFLDDVHVGLSKKGHDTAVVKCFITYVQDLPTGKEVGTFLALDLGGTNFRVLKIELIENHFEMKSKVFEVPKEIMVGSAEALFDHIADCIAKFIKEQKLENQEFALGFTFSFPLSQVGLTTGILQTWTKGFSCDGIIGKDVVQFLKDAIAKKNIKIKVFAILNDTTGTLMSCAWKTRNCKIGIIVGTGTNACYLEKQENAECFDDVDNGSGNIVINTEWGAFGSDGKLDFVRTPYDKTIDEMSINPGKQIFEKMISGMYIGEITRLVLVKLTKAGLLFGGKGSELLFTTGSFITKNVSEIETEPTDRHINCQSILEDLGIDHGTEDDFINVRYVCECVSRRAAHLVSATTAVLINKMDEPHVTIGIDGTLYKLHPYFHDLMMEKISHLINPNLKFDIMLSEDGSGRGAALIAAVVSNKPKTT